MVKWASIILTALSMLVAAAAWVSSVSADLGKQKEKIDALERRREEDRRDHREALSEVKEHVKIIDQNTQIILQKITALEAVQKAERRERSR